MMMCGRFAQISSPQQYAELFGITTDLQRSPRYNVAPSTNIITCVLDDKGKKLMKSLRWGLVPSWSKGPDTRYNMINARAETITEKPAYRGLFKKYRCLIPIDGFYEWKQENGKQPYFIYDVREQPLVLAGLWTHWNNESEQIESCTIIVTAANEQMRDIHDRMPVILPADIWDTWLEENDTQTLQKMLIPSTQIKLTSHAVSREVNSPGNDSDELIKSISSHI